jgi:hypothetical protein
MGLRSVNVFYVLRHSHKVRVGCQPVCCGACVSGGCAGCCLGGEGGEDFGCCGDAEEEPCGEQEGAAVVLTFVGGGGELAGVLESGPVLHRLSLRSRHTSAHTSRCRTTRTRCEPRKPSANLRRTPRPAPRCQRPRLVRNDPFHREDGQYSDSQPGSRPRPAHAQGRSVDSSQTRARIVHESNLILERGSSVRIAIEIPLPEAQLKPVPRPKLQNPPFSDRRYPGSRQRLGISRKHSGINQNRCSIIIRDDSELRRPIRDNQYRQNQVLMIQRQP